MNYRIYTYDGFIMNLSHHVNPKEDNHVVFLCSKTELTEVEVLGIENVVRRISNIFEGLNCNVTISLGHYNKDGNNIKSRSTQSQPFVKALHDKVFYDINENISEYEKKIINQDYKDIVCIEFDNSRRKNSFINNIFHPKKDTVDTYAQKDFDVFY